VGGRYNHRAAEYRAFSDTVCIEIGSRGKCVVGGDKFIGKSRRTGGGLPYLVYGYGLCRRFNAGFINGNGNIPCRRNGNA